MYNGQINVNLVSYADMAVMIVTKHLEDVNIAFDITFEKINQWMSTVGLDLAELKTGALLITSRKLVQTITLKAE